MFDSVKESPQGSFFSIATTEGTDPKITKGKLPVELQVMVGGILLSHGVLSPSTVRCRLLGGAEFSGTSKRFWSWCSLP